MTRSPLSVLVGFAVYLLESPEFKSSEKCFVKHGLNTIFQEK